MLTLCGKKQGLHTGESVELCPWIPSREGEKTSPVVSSSGALSVPNTHFSRKDYALDSMTDADKQRHIQDAEKASHSGCCSTYMRDIASLHPGRLEMQVERWKWIRAPIYIDFERIDPPFLFRFTKISAISVPKHCSLCDQSCFSDRK